MNNLGRTESRSLVNSFNYSPKSSSISPQSGDQPKRWLITGGCGFIGTRLIRSLVSDGCHFIRVVDNLSVGRREDLAQVCDFVDLDPTSLLGQKSAQRAELIVGDILDDKLALKVVKGMDIIVHLAANAGVEPSIKNPRSDCMTNVIGMVNCLEAARKNKIKRFIFASSGAPLGDCKPPIHEELAPHPVSPYGASKLAGEGYCSAYYRTYGVETVALRFGNVYGPGSGYKNSVVAKFIRRAIRGETLEIYGDGRQTRDFIYIDDLIQAIRLAATADGIGGQIFQIATNTETTVAELVDRLLPILESVGINNVQVRHEAPRKGDVLSNFSDTSKAKEILRWEARVELDDGIEYTVKWFSKLLEKKML